MGPTPTLPQTGSVSPDRPDWTDQHFARGPYRKMVESAGARAIVDRAWRTLDVLIGLTGRLGYALAYIEDLAAELNRSVSTIKRDLRALRALGILVVEEAPIIRGGKADAGRRNRYWLTPPDRVAAFAGRVAQAARVASDVGRAAIQNVATVAEQAATAVTRGVRRTVDAARDDPSQTAGGGAHDPSQPRRPLSIQIQNKGTKEEDARARACDPPPVISSDSEQLVDDAATRLGLDLVGDPELGAQLRRDYRSLLRRFGETAAEWLAVQAYDLSGYGLAYWHDADFRPLTLVDTRRRWQRAGCPVGKPDERPGARAGGRSGASTILTYDAILASTEVHLMCPLCRGGDRHYYCARYGHDTPITQTQIDEARAREGSEGMA